MAFGKPDEVGIGAVFIAGFRRIDSAEIVWKKAMSRTGKEAREGAVGILPSCGISRAETDTHEAELDYRRGVKFR